MNYRAFVEISLIDFAQNKGHLQTKSHIFANQTRAEKWLKREVNAIMRSGSIYPLDTTHGGWQIASFREGCERTFDLPPQQRLCRVPRQQKRIKPHKERRVKQLKLFKAVLQ